MANNNTEQKIVWGIIGAGDVTEIKSGPGFQKAPNSELRAIMRRNAAKAEDFARRHQVPHWYDNAEPMLNDPEINAIYIATPPSSHKDYALAAIAAGKNVYIEKPVTLNTEECSELIAATENSQSKVSVAHYRRFLPSFMKLKELLKGGAIGTPLFVSLSMLQSHTSTLIAQTEENWRIDPASSGGGLFHDLAPHQLDLMLHWFGEVTNASGLGINQAGYYEADDCVSGWAKFKNGVMLQGLWHFAVPESQKMDQCKIVGTKGSLTINFFGAQQLHLNNQKREQLFTLPNPTHIQQPMIEQVNEYFRGNRENPCSLHEAAKVMELIDVFARAR